MRSPSDLKFRAFREIGNLVLLAQRPAIPVDAGPFGGGSGGHSHSDTLSVVASYGGEEILTDSGAFTYLADRRQRDRFSGSAAHNTLRVDRWNQADTSRAFGWSDPPAVESAAWSSAPEADYLDAFCRYDSRVLRRRLLFLKPALLLIRDAVEGPSGEHEVEQFWHFASPAAARHLATPVLRGPLPVCLAAAVDLAPQAASGHVELTRDELVWRVRSQGRHDVTAEFPDSGAPPRIHCAGAGTGTLRLC